MGYVLTIIKRFSVLVLLTLMLSCSVIPEDVKVVLNVAGDNRKELEKVITHYKSSGEKEKLKAAYFLIGNLDNKYALGAEILLLKKQLQSFWELNGLFANRAIKIQMNYQLEKE